MSRNEKERLIREFKERNMFKSEYFNLATDIVKILDVGETIETAIKFLEKEQSSIPSNLATGRIVMCIHPKGLEFFETLRKQKLSPFEKKISLQHKLPLQALLRCYNPETMKSEILEILELANCPITYDDDIDFEDFIKLVDAAIDTYFNNYTIRRIDIYSEEMIKTLLDSVLIAIYFIQQDMDNFKKGIIEEPEIENLISVPFARNIPEEKLNKIKEDAVDIGICSDFNNMARILLKSHRAGNNVKSTFDETTFYSCDLKPLITCMLNKWNETTKIMTKI
jgi:hypothetical protein